MVMYVQRNHVHAMCWPNIHICVCVFFWLNHRQDVISTVLCSCSEMLALVFLLFILQSEKTIADLCMWSSRLDGSLSMGIINCFNIPELLLLMLRCFPISLICYDILYKANETTSLRRVVGSLLHFSRKILASYHIFIAYIHYRVQIRLVIMAWVIWRSGGGAEGMS